MYASYPLEEIQNYTLDRFKTFAPPSFIRLACCVRGTPDLLGLGRSFAFGGRADANNLRHGGTAGFLVAVTAVSPFIVTYWPRNLSLWKVVLLGCGPKVPYLLFAFTGMKFAPASHTGILITGSLANFGYLEFDAPSVIDGCPVFYHTGRPL